MPNATEFVELTWQQHFDWDSGHLRAINDKASQTRPNDRVLSIRAYVRAPSAVSFSSIRKRTTILPYEKMGG